MGLEVNGMAEVQLPYLLVLLTLGQVFDAAVETVIEIPTFYI